MEHAESMKTMVRYVTGRHPLERPKQWGIVSKLYGVANIKSSHWVAYMVHLVEEKVVIYDSLMTAYKSSDVVECFENVSRFLPWACRETATYTKLGKVQSTSTEWEVVLAKAIPQQTNGNDCGIMALKFIECLARGIGVDTIKPWMCGEYRNAYCAQLWSISETLDEL